MLGESAFRHEKMIEVFWGFQQILWVNTLINIYVRIAYAVNWIIQDYMEVLLEEYQIKEDTWLKAISVHFGKRQKKAIEIWMNKNLSFNVLKFIYQIKTCFIKQQTL